MYKVFIENTPISFEKGTENYSTVLEQFHPTLETKDYNHLVNTIKQLTEEELTIVSPFPKKTLNTFLKRFKRIHAAGGVVYNTANDSYLFIKRFGKWDLPKGKLEPSESTEFAAIREVEEECGITQLTLKHHLQTTYHTYHMYEQYVLKISDWFYMEYSGEEQLIPQTEEGITEVKWITKRELNEVLKDTYGNIIDVIEQLSLKKIK